MAERKQNNRRNNNGDDDYNPRFRKIRKKVCPLCADKDLVLDYKNADQLKNSLMIRAKSYQEEQQVLAQSIKEI